MRELLAGTKTLVVLTPPGKIDNDVVYPDPDYQDFMPKYSDPGRILFRWYRDGDNVMKSEPYEHDGCCHWIAEGTGTSYWLDSWVDIEREGLFVVEDITGAYYRGDGYSTDDDEEFTPGDVRCATPWEILHEVLEPVVDDMMVSEALVRYIHDHPTKSRIETMRAAIKAALMVQR